MYAAHILIACTQKNVRGTTKTTTWRDVCVAGKRDMHIHILYICTRGERNLTRVDIMVNVRVSVVLIL